MFIMMNVARFAVGMEGVAVCERAYQRARDYAKRRIQGNEVGVRGGPKVPIIVHPDVRRMLMSMKSLTEVNRALAYVVAAAHDKALRHPDAVVRKQNMAFVELMIPVVKGWRTEIDIDAASTGEQVHGGIGYTEEAGAAFVARSRIDAGDSDPFFPAKRITARFFADHQLSKVEGPASSVADGACGVLALAEDWF